MAGRQSWAEGRWWRGGKRDYLAAVVFAVAAVWGLQVLTIQQMSSPPLERYYIATYRSHCVSLRGMTLPYVVWSDDTRSLALNHEVDDAAAVADGVPSFKLSRQAVTDGAKQLLFVQTADDDAPGTCRALAAQIQANRGGVKTRIPFPVLAVLGVIAGAIGTSVVRYRRLAKAMRRGQILRGPELVGGADFQRLRAGDGVGFQIDEPRSPLTAHRGKAATGVLSVRRQDESSHFLLLGDTGTGKSSLIRQLLAQVDTRDEGAIVYDPAMEFTPHFYRPERGDRILNPLDTRMPYWVPGDEIQHKAEALAFAKALFPDDRRDNRFFVESPRKIFARLLSFKPTAQEIAHWLRNPHEIDRLLSGTELASMIDPSAASQRAGVLASLSMVGEAFQLIPDRANSTNDWSAYDWARRRKGWIFITSTPQTLDRLRPLITVWLDLLLMRLLSGGDPVWMFLDELPMLNKLPKLPEALAVARKPNVRLVLGFQGRAQLEARYGTESEAMLSQPATKVFLRTSEPRAAEWISKALGEVEVERLKESVNFDKYLPFLFHRKSHNASLDRQTKPLVLPSEIMGLSNLTGYLKSENHVVRFQFKPQPVLKKHPALELRPVDPNDWPKRPASEPAPVPPAKTGGPTWSGPRAIQKTPDRPCEPSRRATDAAVDREPYFE